MVGLEPGAIVTFEPLSVHERHRLLCRLLVRLAMVGLASLAVGCAAWAIYALAMAGTPRLIIAGCALGGCFFFAQIRALVRKCALARADWRAGVKRVVRGPLLASEHLANQVVGMRPRFRWLIGDTLIGIDVNCDFLFLRGAQGRRLRLIDCVALQRPGAMLEAHMAFASGMTLYVAALAPSCMARFR